MEDTEFGGVPAEVAHLWNCVKEALAANDDPSPRRIDRMASAAGLELAGSTIAGWFKTWSVVPAWEKFEVLVKALAAEKDENWRSLHSAALTADRQRKREERHRTTPGRQATPVAVEPPENRLVTTRHSDLPSLLPNPALGAMPWGRCPGS